MWPNQQFPAILLTYTEEIFNGKLHFLCSAAVHYIYFQSYYEMVPIDLSQQQSLDADPKKIQQINFTGNLDRAGNTIIFFIIEEAKKIILDFSQGTS